MVNCSPRDSENRTKLFCTIFCFVYLTGETCKPSQASCSGGPGSIRPHAGLGVPWTESCSTCWC